MVVHVAVKEPQHRVQVHGARGKTVVLDAGRQGSVLGNAQHPVHRRAQRPGQQQQADRQPRLHPDGNTDNGDVARQEQPGIAKHLGKFGFGDGYPDKMIRMADSQLQQFLVVIPYLVPAAGQAQDIEPANRVRQQVLRIVPDVGSMGVMPGVHPLQRYRFPAQHPTAQVKQRLVQGVAPERRAVAGFMTCRVVEGPQGAVQQHDAECPPGAPGVD